MGHKTRIWIGISWTTHHSTWRSSFRGSVSSCVSGHPWTHQLHHDTLVIGWLLVWNQRRRGHFISTRPRSKLLSFRALLSVTFPNCDSSTGFAIQIHFLEIWWKHDLKTWIIATRRVPILLHCYLYLFMMTSSNGNIFRVTGPLWGESTGHRWIPLTEASYVELWYFLWSSPEQTVEQTTETLVIRDTIALIMTSL